MKKKVKLFSLKPGDRFTFNETDYTVKYYKNKYMPTLGYIYNIVCFDNKGEIQKFIHNWEVEL